MSDGVPPSINEPWDSPKDSLQAQYDWTLTQPSVAVIGTIATAKDVHPTNLPVLFSCIDLDALDALFKSKTGLLDEPDITLSFSIESHEVTVQSDGKVTVASNTTGP